MHREVGFSLLFDILILLFPVEKEIRERERRFATTCATTVYKLPSSAVSVPPRQPNNFQNAASSTNSGSLGQQPYRQHQRPTTTPTRILHARAIHESFHRQRPSTRPIPSAADRRCHGKSFRRGPFLLGAPSIRTSKDYVGDSLSAKNG